MQSMISQNTLLIKYVSIYAKKLLQSHVCNYIIRCLTSWFRCELWIVEDILFCKCQDWITIYQGTLKAIVYNSSFFSPFYVRNITKTPGFFSGFFFAGFLFLKNILKCLSVISGLNGWCGAYLGSYHLIFRMGGLAWKFWVLFIFRSVWSCLLFFSFLFLVYRDCFFT